MYLYIVEEDNIYIMVDGKPEILNEDIHLGQVDPGQSINKTIYLYGSLLTGSRLVTLTVVKKKKIRFYNRRENFGSIIYKRSSY